MTATSEQMTAEQHRAYGLHSNIPACCVDWWVAEHRKDDGTHVWHAGKLRCLVHKNCGWRPAGAIMDARGLPKLTCQYVLCPKCHAEVANGVRVPNELHLCSNDDETCRVFHPDGVSRRWIVTTLSVRATSEEQP